MPSFFHSAHSIFGAAKTHPKRNSFYIWRVMKYNRMILLNRIKLLFAFALIHIISSTLVAQNPISLWGKVDTIPDVNIRIYETEYGTSTNRFGEYFFTIFPLNENVTLHFSCIGYQDTILTVDLTNAKSDSINLNLKLHSIDYQLGEFVVSGKPHFIQLPGERILDIEYLHNEIILLASHGGNTSAYVYDLNGDILCKQNLMEKYKGIHRDCFGNLILVSRDYCLQIFYNDSDSVLYSIDKFSTNDFQNKLKPFLLEYHDHLLLTTSFEGKNKFYIDPHHHKKAEYFYVDKNNQNGQPVHLISFFDKQAFQVAQSIYGEIIERYYQVTPEKQNIFELGMWDGNNLRLANNDPTLFNLVSWYQNIESKSIRIHVFVQNDKLLFFDCANYQLVKFDQDWHLTDSISISDYDKFKSIIQDLKTGCIYGLIEKNGLYSIAEINIKNGSKSEAVSVNSVQFMDFVKVFDNMVYVAYFNPITRAGIVERKNIAHDKN